MHIVALNMTNKQTTIFNLANRQRFNTAITMVETITLDYKENPEGFKLYTNSDGDLIDIHYWYQELNPYHYKEERLTDSEWGIVEEWYKHDK